MTDSKAKLSLIGILQIEEDAIAELFGELRLDNITMKKQYRCADFMQRQL